MPILGQDTAEPLQDNNPKKELSSKKSTVQPD